MAASSLVALEKKEDEHIHWNHPKMPRVHHGTLIEAVDYLLQNFSKLPPSLVCDTDEGHLWVMCSTNEGRSLAFVGIEVKPELRRQGKCRGFLRHACSSVGFVDRIYVYMPGEPVLKILREEGFQEAASAEFFKDTRKVSSEGKEEPNSA